MTVRKVAIIGAGAMGGPMARRLRTAGFELTVCDSNAQTLAAFAGTGTRTTHWPADCAEADVVLVVVATGEQVRDVLLGAQGLKAGLAAGCTPIVAVMSTVSASVLDGVQAQLRGTGVRLVDAPISGGSLGAEQGTLTVLTAGDAQDVAALVPVFEPISRRQIHCGALGAAQTMKILNNTIGIATAVLAGEIYRVALEMDLAPERLSEVLEACSGRVLQSKDPAGPHAAYASMARDRATFTGLEGVMRKDLDLALQLASRAAGSYPAVAAIKALVDGLGEETFDHWRRVGGLEPPQSRSS